MNKITVTITISPDELTNLLSLLPKGTAFTMGEVAAAPAKVQNDSRTFNCTAVTHVEGCWIKKTGLKTFTAQYERQGLRSIECAKAGQDITATVALAKLHAARNGSPAPTTPKPEPVVEETPELPAPDVDVLVAELIALKTTDMRAYGVLLKKVVHVWKMDVIAIQNAVKAGVALLEPPKADSEKSSLTLTSYPTN